MNADSHQRTRSQPVPAFVSQSGSKAIATTTAASRARAPSDPFVDDHTPVLSRSLASSQPRSPTTPTGENIPEIAGLLPTLNATADDASELDGEEYTRAWTVPDLPDAEFNALLRLFPTFIGQRQLPRFPVHSGVKDDVEAGGVDDLDSRSVRFGTGRIWAGSRKRSAGYRGGVWARFVAWWRQMFCR
jgi:hypothetical protein